ncbi:MAG: plasmid pRiA4b ORF-3 family protein, partial [Solobacterium sp.]|nr:plasmid pRiA4b ORF-3 family protein [Solobacterium sp.]
IDVPASMRFSMLSDVIQTLFGFDGYHLSSFDFRELPFSLRSYTEEDDWELSFPMDKFQLGNFEFVSNFTYTYDFGDDWEFSVKRESIWNSFGEDHPVLIKSKGGKLVEDIGGVWAYNDLVRSLAHPSRASKETDDEDEDEFLEDLTPEDIEFSMESAAEALTIYKCSSEDPQVMSSDDLEQILAEFDDDDDDDDDEIYGNLPDEFNSPERLMELMSKMISASIIVENLQKGKLPKKKEDFEFLLSLTGISSVGQAINEISEKMDLAKDDLINCLSLNAEEKSMMKLFCSSDGKFGKPSDDDDNIPF